MSRTIEIDFEPRDYVTVTLFDLKYHGRVSKVIVHDHNCTYDVEYADDKGDLIIRNFRKDEIAPRSASQERG